MRNKPTLDIVFYAYEALFRDDIELQETCLPKISDIPIKLIDNFPAHQFMVIMDEDMEYLIESIKNKEKVHIPYNEIQQYIPSGVSFEKTAEYIKNTLVFYQQNRSKGPTP